MAQRSTGQAPDVPDAGGQGSTVISSDVADRRARRQRPDRPLPLTAARPYRLHLRLPRRPPCPLPRGAGTESQGPMDRPDTRLTSHG